MPLPKELGDFYFEWQSIGAGATTACINQSYSFGSDGTFQMWAQVDADQDLTRRESDYVGRVYEFVM